MIVSVIISILRILLYTICYLNNVKLFDDLFNSETKMDIFLALVRMILLTLFITAFTVIFVSGVKGSIFGITLVVLFNAGLVLLISGVIYIFTMKQR